METTGEKEMWHTVNDLPERDAIIIVLHSDSLNAVHWTKQKHDNNEYKYDWLVWGYLEDVVLRQQQLAKISLGLLTALGGLLYTYKQQAKTSPSLAPLYNGFADVIEEMLEKIGAISQPTLQDVIALVQSKDVETGFNAYMSNVWPSKE